MIKAMLFGRQRTERGAVMVEMALVGTILATLAIGVAEVGFAWRDASVAEQASRAGARTGSAMGLDDQADRALLGSMVSVLGPQITGSVDYVVVYQPQPDGSMPSGCESASSSVCNHYPPEALEELEVAAVWGCGAGAYDSGWCPGSRKGSAETPTELGVVVKLKHQWLSGMMPGDGTAITGRTVMRIQPER